MKGPVLRAEEKLWPKESASDLLFASKGLILHALFVLTLFWNLKNAQKESDFLGTLVTEMTLPLSCISTFSTVIQFYNTQHLCVRQFLVISEDWRDRKTGLLLIISLGESVTGAASRV